MANARLTAPLVIAAGAIWPPVCTTAVCLRFYTRHVQNNRLLADDWLLIPALVCIELWDERSQSISNYESCPRSFWLACALRHFVVWSNSCTQFRVLLLNRNLLGVALHSVGYPTPKPASAYAEAHYASYQQQTTRKVICFKLLEISGD